MDKTEKESAELSQSESSGTQSTEPDPNHRQLKVKSSEKDSTDTESDGLEHKDVDAELADCDATTAESPKTDGSGSTESEHTNDLDDKADHLPDELDAQAAGDTDEEESDRSDKKKAVEAKADEDFSAADESLQKADRNEMDPVDQLDGDTDQTDQQQGTPEEEASLDSQQKLHTDPNSVGDKAVPPPGNSDQQVIADENQTASEHALSEEAQAVDGSGASAEPAAEAQTPAEIEADSDQTQSASKEASIPQVNAETPSEADDAISAAADPDDQRTEDQEDPDLETAEHAPDAVASKTPIVKIAVSAVLITAVFSGFFLFENKSKITKDQTVAETPSEDQPQPLQLETKQIVAISSAVSPSIYDDPINEVSILRDSLLIKQAEVLALITRYRQSIDELEKEILDAQREADVQTFLQAANHKRIVFSLKTIQRRQAYIRQLQKPLEWVSGACEELLYLKRRVMTDLQVSAIAAGIDMDRHVQQMHRALKEYRPTADKLAIDPTDARLESLEAIWQRVQNKQDVVAAEPVYSKNHMISAQICAGDFHRVGELSEMTTKTAKCITEMQASDLFLNQVTEITPAAARQLCEWKGSWICMNGVRALSPRAAHYLFQWDGHWISLNGLTEFPAEIGEALLKWQGRQLELMGLLDTDDAHARIGIEYLAEWERSGGKLFVPENLRKKIDALHQTSG